MEILWGKLLISHDRNHESLSKRLPDFSFSSYNHQIHSQQLSYLAQNACQRVVTNYLLPKSALADWYDATETMCNRAQVVTVQLYRRDEIIEFIPCLCPNGDGKLSSTLDEFCNHFRQTERNSPEPHGRVCLAPSSPRRDPDSIFRDQGQNDTKCMCARP